VANRAEQAAALTLGSVNVAARVLDGIIRLHWQRLTAAPPAHWRV
jgi:hypothetical protein